MIKFIKNLTNTFKSQAVLTQGQTPKLSKSIVTAQTGYAYACINKIANYVQAVEYTIQSEYKLLLENPNQAVGYSFKDLLKLIVHSLYIDGEVFIWVNAQNSKPLQYWVIPANRVTIVRNGRTDQLVSSYKIQWESGIIEVMPESVIHIRNYAYDSLLSSLYLRGKPDRMNSVKSVIEADLQNITYISEYFSNYAVPPMMFKTRQHLEPHQITKLRESYNNLFNSTPPPLLITSDEDEFSAITGGSDLASIMVDGSISSDVIKRITASFGMNPNILFQEFANKATIETMMEHFVSYTVNPLIQQITDAFNGFFNLNKINAKLEFKPLQFTNAEIYHQQTIELVNAGIISKNEARQRLGIEGEIKEEREVLELSKKKHLSTLKQFGRKSQNS